jgi:hypothetical protein
VKYTLLKDQLIFKEGYNWNEIQITDPRVSGSLTETPFNPSEGYEILYLINELISTWKFDGEQYARKLEKMIKCGVTGGAMNQKEVKDWIKAHWMDY